MYDICMIYVILCNNNIHKVGQKYCCLKAWWWILREPVTQLRRSSHFKMDHHPSGPARLPAMEISPVMWTTLYIIEYIYIYTYIYDIYIYIYIYISINSNYLYDYIWLGSHVPTRDAPPQEVPSLQRSLSRASNRNMWWLLRNTLELIQNPPKK